MLRTENRPAASSRTLTVVDWAQDLERWIVSAQLGDEWTLIGLFEQAHVAFRAADRASSSLGAELDPAGESCATSGDASTPSN